MIRRSIPNTITIARLCALPLFVWLYSRDAPQASWPAAILLLIMALSDVADGRLARRYHWQTDLGRMLDPVADRLLFLCLAVSLLAFGTLPWWAVVPLIARDCVLLGGSAIVLLRYGERPEIMRGGRIANAVLVCGIEFLVVNVRVAGWLVYSLGATLYVLTGVRYLWREYTHRRASRHGDPA